MPGLNRRGPQGEGPKSGKMQGLCNKTADELSNQSGFGRGRNQVTNTTELGFGRGRRRGGTNKGRGFRNGQCGRGSRAQQM